MKKLFIIIGLLMAYNLFATPDTLTVQAVTVAGVQQSLSAVTDDTLRVLNDDGMTTWVRIKNAGAEMTATVVSKASTNYAVIPAGLSATNTTVTISATTGDFVIGPFRASGYNDSDKYIMIVLSRTSDITAQAFDMD
jgi:hypothetical protein